MTITFYTFSKKRNSTAQPTGGTSYTGTLTQESGIVSPSVIMDFGNTAPAYNYAYITEFRRYYWITEITSIGGGLWRVSMTVDVLATYKSDIGAASKYVLRSASEFDGSVMDTKYPTKVNYSRNLLSKNSGWPIGSATGRYVVGVVDANGTFGSVSVYCLNESQFSALRAAIAPSSYYNSITDTDLKNLAVTVVNPMQYIAWVKYYPFSVPQSQNFVTMNLGNISIPNMSLIGNVTVSDVFEYDLTAHPLAATRGTYLNYDPFTIRFFSWLPVGMIHIPALSAGLMKIDVFYIVDVISGTGDLIIRDHTTDQNELYRTSFACGIDIPVAQVVSSNPLKIVSGTINMLSAGMSAILGNVPGSVASGISGITDFITSQVGEVQAFKPGSGALLTDPQARIIEYFADVMDDDNPEFGRPLCKVKAISTLSGYVLCADGEVPAAGATQSELADIESYLTGGFYYE